MGKNKKAKRESHLPLKNGPGKRAQRGKRPREVGAPPVTDESNTETSRLRLRGKKAGDSPPASTQGYNSRRGKGWTEAGRGVNKGNKKQEKKKKPHLKIMKQGIGTMKRNHTKRPKKKKKSRKTLEREQGRQKGAPR